MNGGTRCLSRPSRERERDLFVCNSFRVFQSFYLKVCVISWVASKQAVNEDFEFLKNVSCAPRPTRQL